MIARQVSGDIDHSASHRGADRLLHLDGWRGICIISVLIGHFWPVPFIDLGALGVDMFFVLSGRLMADILFVERVPLGWFYLRRFSRVWPGLAVYTLVCLAVFSWQPGFLHVDWQSALAALTFFMNYKVVFTGETAMLDHIWSLCVEEHSYLLLGLIAWLSGRGTLRMTKLILLFGAMIMAANGVIQHQVWPERGSFVYWQSDVRAASIFFSAFIYLELKQHPLRAAWLPYVAMTIGGLLYVRVVPISICFVLGPVCLALAVCCLDTIPRGARKPFEWRPFMTFGTYSFSIYIWQQLFYKLLQNFRADGDLTFLQSLFARPVLVALGCLIGAASYALIENPARRAINRRWSLSRRQGAEATIIAPAPNTPLNRAAR